MRIDQRPRLLGALLALVLGACSPSQSIGEIAAAPPAATGAAVPERTLPGTTEPGTSQPAARGLGFAQTHCSACHAIRRLGISPNPEAPPFAAVVNTPGLTSVTLTSWLRASHNFPEIMNFDIEPGQIEDLAAYMMTLREND